MFYSTWERWREGRSHSGSGIQNADADSVAFDLLEFRTGDRPSHDHWEGPVPFTGPSRIDVWLEAGEGGPTERQLQHYSELVRRYDEVSASVWPELIAAYEEWFNRRPRLAPDQWFSPALLRLPAGGDVTEWELTFTARDCPQFLFSAIMSGWRCVDVAVLDGRMT